MSNFYNNVLKKLNENNDVVFSSEDVSVDIGKADSIISAVMGKQWEIKNYKVLLNPLISTIKSEWDILVIYDIEEKNKQLSFVHGVSFKQNKINSAQSRFMYLPIIGAVPTNNTAELSNVTICTPEQVYKYVSSINEKSARLFVDFMFEQGDYQFNWKGFLKELEGHVQNYTANYNKNLSVAKSLYKKLAKAGKQIQDVVDFMKIVSPDGTAEYEGVSYTILMDLLLKISKGNA